MISKFGAAAKIEQCFHIGKSNWVKYDAKLPKSRYFSDMKYLNHTVWLLGAISLFTDMASEMLYPIMPLYLKTIGFSVFWIGLLEGLAEATAGLSKGYFGHWSDVINRRAPFVQFGYTLSALSKPMMALLSTPLGVFSARTLDRLGKGIRTGARDAMLSDASSPETKGRVFGFHRAMDTLGAVIGPAFALYYLYLYPGDYKNLFLIAFVPGLLAIAAGFLLTDEKHKKGAKSKVRLHISLKRGVLYWQQAAPAYRSLLKPMLLFALFNSSDAFLLLQMKQTGLSDTWVIGVYIFYNLVYALLAFPAGIIADKWGLKKTFLFGLLCFIAVYVGMAVGGGLWFYAVLFFLYGAYAASTEGILKAWISQIAPAKETAQAIGAYAGLQSICALVASTGTGLIWFYAGSATAFGLSAGATLITFLLLLRQPETSLQAH
jgi:MFS family permease